MVKYSVYFYISTFLKQEDNLTYFDIKYDYVKSNFKIFILQLCNMSLRKSIYTIIS